ncbi:hypothetical protein LTR96_011222 [Exophiala xenobiotica]|nr:hypothetical protein LTR41_011640 [Exophiala xenobiotica]KAK5215639.1 hypothetical protein LTR72_011322 [Exophiala xenobiotica]KAK5220221.1 hypothetical protein LTR47_011337 [Exophiala xenobiotica]KAK5244437.1 hypothetical protein LTS06_009984 [Exophiala xenobiotica]KAK5263372.1 hypothetical protein LTR96_011222 [Exophiala xenobiotica]
MGVDTFTGVPQDGNSPLGFFKVGYDSDPTQAPNGLSQAVNLRTAIDQVFTQCEAWFPGVSTAMASIPRYQTMPIHVTQPNQIPGLDATWTAHGGNPRIQLSPNPINPAEDNQRLLVFTMFELSEMFMDAQNTGWFATNEGSTGEGLSHYLAKEFAPLVGVSDFFDPFANQWMTLAPVDPAKGEQDPRLRGLATISSSDLTTDEGPHSALALLFIEYLHTQLGFSTEEIIAAGNNDPSEIPGKLSLADVYRNLTSDDSGAIGDPFNVSDPWPLVNFNLVGPTNLSFQADDVNDAIINGANNPVGGIILEIEGLSLFTFEFLRRTGNVSDGSSNSPANPDIKATGVPNIIFSMAVRGLPPITSNPRVPQKIIVQFGITFNSVDNFPAAGAGPTSVEVVATLDYTGLPFLPTDSPSVNILSRKMTILLFPPSNPRFINQPFSFSNGAPSQNPWYLSNDLRVFAATPRRDNMPVKHVQGHPPPPVSATDPNYLNINADDTPFAWKYLSELLTWLNTNFTRPPPPEEGPAGEDPFYLGLPIIPQDPDVLTQPSTVLPWSFWYAVDGSRLLARNYNFAIARVQLGGGSLARASAVEVFFRLFVADPFDTTFNENMSYQTDRTFGHAPFPLPVDGVSLPLFGTPISSSQLLASGAPNTRTPSLALRVSTKRTLWLVIHPPEKSGPGMAASSTSTIQGFRETAITASSLRLKTLQTQSRALVLAS